jgi:hypothetical protein
MALELLFATKMYIAGWGGTQKFAALCRCGVGIGSPKGHAWVSQGPPKRVAWEAQGTICESAFVCNENQKMTGWGVLARSDDRGIG